MNIIKKIAVEGAAQRALLKPKLLSIAKTTGQVPSCNTCTQKDPGCCYQKVVVPVHEALVIAEHLAAGGRDTSELREQLRRDGHDMSVATRAQWFKSKRICAFITDDGKCGIYNVRPFACSSYFVVSDPARCHPDSEDNRVAIVNVQQELAFTLAENRRIHRDTLALKETDFRVLIGALPRLVLMMLEGMNLSKDGFRDFVRGQKWFSVNQIEDDWVIQP